MQRFYKINIIKKLNKMEVNLSHEESLTLINEMICRARNNVRVKGAKSLIFWGYVTAALAIANSVLIHILNGQYQSFWIWGLMVPAAVVGFFIERRNRQKTLVKTHIDKIGSMIWLGFFISFAVFTVVIHTVNISQIIMINVPVMMILVGMGQFVTACAFRSKMWYLFASLSWTAAIACAFSPLDVQLIIFAAFMIVGFVIPGHILNRQSKESHV